MEKPLSVLIVEDNTVFRSMAMQVFDRHTKFYTASAQSGLEMFKNQCPDITLVDIGLPDGNGLDLLDDMIAYNPEAFVVMLTASCILSDVTRAKESGAIGYIVKPCTPKKLLECIDRYNDFRKKTEALSPEQRAGNYLEKLRIDSVNRDVSEHSMPFKEQPAIGQPQQNNKIFTAPQLPENVQNVLESWRVLFVDDYLVNRERARIQLSRLGCRVETAEDGEKLLILSEKKAYNLIFLDTQTAGIDGYKVARDLRQYELSKGRPPAIIIAMVEANYEIENKLWQHAGMNGFIRKPARFTKLREELEKHARLQTEQYVE